MHTGLALGYRASQYYSEGMVAVLHIHHEEAQRCREDEVSYLAWLLLGIKRGLRRNNKTLLEANLAEMLRSFRISLAPNFNLR